MQTTDWQGLAYAAFFQLLFHIPTIIVYVIGIVISFIKAKKHPKISVLSGIAFAILLILSIVSIFITLLPTYFFSRGYSTQNIGFILSTIGVIMTVFTAAASALLLSAVWKDRS